MLGHDPREDERPEPYDAEYEREEAAYQRHMSEQPVTARVPWEYLGWMIAVVVLCILLVAGGSR